MSSHSPTPLSEESFSGEQPSAQPRDSEQLAIIKRPAEPHRSGWSSSRWLLLGGAGLLGLGVWWLWWLFGRLAAQPQILEFFPEKSDYSVASREPIELGWAIANAHRIETLKLAGYDPDGKLISGPITYDLSNGLPAALADVCEQQASVLTCRNVEAEARQPGDYVFELSLISKDSPPERLQATTSQVSIAALPLPTVAELAPDQVIYAEAGTPAAATPIPPVGSQGITLSWVVINPQLIQDLLLIVRKADDTVLGGRRFTLRNPNDPAQISLPPGLEPYCQLSGALICQNVPSGIGDVGQYSFELSPVVVGQPEAVAGEISEQVEVLPRPVRINSFQINGAEAQPKYLIPVEPGQPPPPFLVSWQVEGGSTATARLLPSPGTVALSGSAPFPLSPEPGETTLTLEVSDGTGSPLLRSVTIQTFDPTPNALPAGAASVGAAAANPAGTPSQPGPGIDPQSPARAIPRLEQPRPISPDPGSPADSPPQFD